MINHQIIVKGMVCAGCANLVKTALSSVDGVDAVRVDLHSGEVEVASAGPLTVEALANAVDGYGYSVVAS